MTCNPCATPISGSCVFIKPSTAFSTLTGKNAESLFESVDSHLTDLYGIVNTTPLIKRTLNPLFFQSLPTLLQGLIDTVSSQQGVIDSLTQDESSSLSLDTVLPGTTQTLVQVLNSLLQSVTSLQSDVSAIKAGQPASTSLYIPHY